MFQALVAHFESQKRNALATLELYLNKSVSTHANLAVGEAAEQVKLLAEAEEALTALQAMLPSPEEQSSNES